MLGRRLLAAAAAGVVLIGTTAAMAAERTVTLEVGNLFCASCPYIVQQVLAEVPGVTQAEVSYRERTAVVTFDDEQADVATLTAATAAYGFPSRPRQ